MKASKRFIVASPSAVQRPMWAFMTFGQGAMDGWRPSGWNNVTIFLWRNADILALAIAKHERPQNLSITGLGLAFHGGRKNYSTMLLAHSFNSLSCCLAFSSRK